jgi:hypothetical protein
MWVEILSIRTRFRPANQADCKILTKVSKNVLQPICALTIINFVLSVDDFGDWATPKKHPAGLFFAFAFLVRAFHFISIAVATGCAQSQNG